MHFNGVAYDLKPTLPQQLTNTLTITSNHPPPTPRLRPLEELISHRVVPTLCTQFQTLWEVAQLRAVWQVLVESN